MPYVRKYTLGNMKLELPLTPPQDSRTTVFCNSKAVTNDSEIFCNTVDAREVFGFEAVPSSSRTCGHNHRNVALHCPGRK